MAIREIRVKDDEVLYKKCKEVVNFDKKLHIVLLLHLLRSSPFSFPVKEIAEVKPYLTPVDIIIRITAGVKTDKFKSLMKIESDGVCIAGLRLQNDGAPFLTDSNFLCLIHQPPANAFPPKRFAYP